jgi:predicted RNase H-like HicB family nuclease
MSEKLRLTIAYEEPDEDGWIVAQVVEVPGAISQGKSPRGSA